MKGLSKVNQQLSKLAMQTQVSYQPAPLSFPAPVASRAMPGTVVGPGHCLSGAGRRGPGIPPTETTGTSTPSKWEGHVVSIFDFLSWTKKKETCLCSA